MHLKYETDWDFWKFYKENFEDVETIIWKVCWQNKKRYDPEDLHSEILLRLHRNNPLKRFDPSASQLNTYLTQRVWYESLHILTEDKAEQDADRNRVLIKGLNAVDPSSHFDENALPELTCEDDALEEDISTKDLIQKIQKKLPASLNKIFMLRLKGFSFTAIARMYGVSCWCVCKRCEKIRNLSARLLKRNNVCVTKQSSVTI